MTALTYLLYAKTGREFEVTDALHAMGLDAWCGRKIEWRRRGHRRYPDAIEVPALPNYLFAEIPAEAYHAAMRVKHIAPFTSVLSQGDVRNLAKFRDMTDRAHEAGLRAKANNEAPKTVFNVGEALEIVGGTFANTIATFRRMVEAPGKMHPVLEVDAPVGRLRIDPLDVRKTGGT